MRRWVGRQAKVSRLSGQTVVRKGFGVAPAPDDYPSKDVLRRLMMKDGVAPRSIWRAVQAWHLAQHGHPLRRRRSWPERLKFVEDDPETMERLRARHRIRSEWYLFPGSVRCPGSLRRRMAGHVSDDPRLAASGARDAFVSAASREDLPAFRFRWTRTRIADFPDASKILSSAAEPNWLRHDLDGLVWHCLVNGEHGETFRQQLGLGMQSSARIGPQRPKPTTTLPPRPSPFDEAHQRERFHEITGPWMGRGPRRGFPYTWIPNHLADTNGKVGPRSLLAALRTAAADTEDRHSGHDYALHYESIKRGVQRASEIRVGEVQEEYPWMHRVLQSLGGMTVPCEFEEIEKRWHDAQTLDAF